MFINTVDLNISSIQENCRRLLQLSLKTDSQTLLHNSQILMKTTRDVTTKSINIMHISNKHNVYVLKE